MASGNVQQVARRFRRSVLCLAAVCVALLRTGDRASLAADTTPQDTARGTAPVPSAAPDLGHAYHESYALLIGIDKYKNLPPGNQLNYAVKDVTALRDMLVQKYGFKSQNVKLLQDQDATRDHINDALADLVDKTKIQEADCILIYFAGHGQAVKIDKGGEVGFLLPHDANVNLDDKENLTPYRKSCIDMEKVFADLEDGPSLHVLLMADVCFSGCFILHREPRPALAKTPDPEIARLMLKRRATQVITAGTSDQTVQEAGKLGHGAFTYALLSELKARFDAGQRYFTARQLHDQLQIAVPDLTHNHQLPQIGNGDKSPGEFLFFPQGNQVKGPHIDVLEPEDDLTVVNGKIVLHVRVTDAVDIASITLRANRKPVALADPSLAMVNGAWERNQVLNLDPGENSIVITVVDADGEPDTVRRKVTYLLPKNASHP